jgi:hypothetical protein
MASARTQAMIRVARQARSRPRVGRPEWSTPVVLWVLMGAVGVSALLAFLSISLGVADSGRAFQVVGSQTAPTINDALGIYFAVSDMDADAADYLLLNGNPSGSVTPAGVLNRYEQRRQAASDLLLSAAHNPSYDASEHTAILRMMVMIQIFDAYVEEAEVLNDRGDRPNALAAYGQATDLMHAPQSGLLETALGLASSLHQDLTTRYDAAQADEGRDTVLVLLSMLLVIGVLVVLQVFLLRRTRRLLSLPAAGATLLAVVLLAASISTLRANDDRLAAAKTDGYDSVYALRQLRAIAFDAKADESRFLIDPSRAQLNQASFLAKSVELASFRQQVTIDTYDAALGEQVTALRSGRRVVIGGAFGRALAHVVFPGEEPAATAALTDYARFQRDDRVLRADLESGRPAEAVRFDTSSAPGDSEGDFLAFDSALGAWIQIHQQAFDQEIAAGNGALNGWQVYAVLGPLLIVGLAWLGVRPRLREYA